LSRYLQSVDSGRSVNREPLLLCPLKVDGHGFVFTARFQHRVQCNRSAFGHWSLDVDPAKTETLYPTVLVKHNVSDIPHLGTAGGVHRATLQFIAPHPVSSSSHFILAVDDVGVRNQHRIYTPGNDVSSTDEKVCAAKKTFRTQVDTRDRAQVGGEIQILDFADNAAIAEA